MAIQKYIQDPNNPNASMLNPAYVEPTSVPETVPTAPVTEPKVTVPEQKSEPTILTGAMPEPATSKKTLADLGLTFDQTEEEKAIEEAQKGILATYPTGIEEGDVRKSTLDTFQKQIDALESVKRQKLAEIESRYAQKQKENLGSSRAILAGAGMLGQVGGESVQQNIISGLEAKKQVEIGTLESEAEEKIQGLLSTARTAGETAVTAKTKAYREGGQALIDYLKGRGETRTSNTKKFVESAIASDVDLTKEDLTEYAKSLGVSKSDILSAYKTAKLASDKAKSEALKAEQEARKTEAETGKITAETYKLQNPEKDYKNIKEVDGGLYDLSENKWLVAPKNKEDVYEYDPKTGTIFNKTKGVVTNQGTTGGSVASKVANYDTKIKEIDDLLKEDTPLGGMRGAVGVNPLARFNIANVVTGSQQKFIGGVERLVQDLALQNLIKSKGEGATFGALSDAELKLLMETASPIAKWAIKDDKGKVIGYDANEGDFVNELNRIKGQFQTNKAVDLGKSLGENESDIRRSIQDFGIDKVLQKLDEKSKNISGGSGTPIATKDLASAITAQESGGNYQAVNKDSGALGAHQIMPFHLPKIGLTTSTADRQTFLNSPDLQDELQQKIIDENIKTFGSKEKAIAAYYGGGTAAQNYGTSQGDRQGKYDTLGRKTGYPSVNEYVAQVLSRLNG
jgi:hypothetical protein